MLDLADKDAGSKKLILRKVFPLEESSEDILLHHRPHPDRSRDPGMDQFHGEEGRDCFLL